MQQKTKAEDTVQDCQLAKSQSAAWLRVLTAAAEALPPALLQEGGGATLTYDWSSYYWAGNVLLAELTDGGTFHQQSQHFLKMWVCGSGGVSRLIWRPLGRT